MATSSNRDMIFPPAVWNIGLVLFAIFVPFVVVLLGLVIAQWAGLVLIDPLLQVLLIGGSFAVGLLTLTRIRSRRWLRIIVELLYIPVVIQPLATFYLAVATFATCGLCTNM